MNPVVKDWEPTHTRSWQPRGKGHENEQLHQRDTYNVFFLSLYKKRRISSTWRRRKIHWAELGILTADQVVNVFPKDGETRNNRQKGLRAARGRGGLHLAKAQGMNWSWREEHAQRNPERKANLLEYCHLCLRAWAWCNGRHRKDLRRIPWETEHLCSRIISLLPG